MSARGRIELDGDLAADTWSQLNPLKADQKLGRLLRPDGIGAERGVNTPVSANNVCMVKIVVGPGNSGPADAPSKSERIGIEVWLPDIANWNDRLHALGGGDDRRGGDGPPQSF